MADGQDKVVLERKDKQDVDVHADGEVEADEGFRP